MPYKSVYCIDFFTFKGVQSQANRLWINRSLLESRAYPKKHIYVDDPYRADAKRSLANDKNNNNNNNNNDHAATPPAMKVQTMVRRDR